MEMSVDDPHDRLVRDFPDSFKELRCILFELSVYDQHSLITHLHRSIAPRANQHVNVSLHRQRAKILTSKGRSANSQQERQDYSIEVAGAAGHCNLLQ